MNDNVIQFPGVLQEAIKEEEWKALQAEFYLDCYLAAQGEPASNPADLEAWLLQARIKAELDNPFFRGWLVRRLSEASKA